RGFSRRLLAEGPDEPAVARDAAQGEHGRVRRQDGALASGRRQLEAAIERLLEIGYDLDRRLVEAAVLEPQPELRCSRARRDQPLEAADQRLEVDVPDPGDVLTVRDRVVERDHGDPRRPALDERPNRLV